MAKSLNIFFVGDINGKPGMTLISSLLKQYIQKYEIDFCVVNGDLIFKLDVAEMFDAQDSLMEWAWEHADELTLNRALAGRTRHGGTSAQ